MTEADACESFDARITCTPLNIVVKTCRSISPGHMADWASLINASYSGVVVTIQGFAHFHIIIHKYEEMHFLS